MPVGFDRRAALTSIVLTLLVLTSGAVVALGAPTARTLAGHGTASPTGPLSPSAGVIPLAGSNVSLPVVESTTFLTNGTVAACDCFGPTAQTASSLIYDSGRGLVWVGDVATGSLVAIDPVSNQVERTIAGMGQTAPAGLASAELAYQPNPGAVLFPFQGTSVGGLPYFTPARVGVTNDSTSWGGPFSWIPVPSRSVTGETYDPATGDLFISEGFSNAVAVVSVTSSTVLANISVSNAGWSVLDPSTGTVFVACSTGVCAISDSSRSLSATIPVPGVCQSCAEELTYDSGSGELFALTPSTGNLTVISATNDTVVASLSAFPAFSGTGTPPAVALAYDPVDSEVFASDAAYGIVAVSDTNNTVLAHLPGTVGTLDLAFAPGQDELFAGHWSGMVQVFAGSNASLLTAIPVGVIPQSVVFDSGTDQFFVASLSGTGVRLQAVSGANGSVAATIPLPGSFTHLAQGIGLAYDSAHSEIFLGDPADDAVLVVSDASDSVVGTIGVGSSPGGVAYDPQQGVVFVALQGSSQLSVINDTNLSVVSTIPVCASPNGLAYDPADGSLFVLCSGSASVDVVSTVYDTVAATISLPAWAAPWAASYSPDLGEVFVDNAGGTGYLFVLNATNDSLSAVWNTSDPVSYQLLSVGTQVLVPGGGWAVEVLDGISGRLLGYLDTAQNAVAIGFDPLNNTTLIANDVAGTVAVLAPPAPVARLIVQEAGLPAGRSWGVTIGYPGVTRSTTQSSLAFSVPTGLVPYAVKSPFGWGASRVLGQLSSGSEAVRVSTNQLLKVEFGPLEVFSFNESALPGFELYSGANWSVGLTPVFGTAGPVAQFGSTDGTTIQFGVPAGAVYRFTIHGPGSEYRALPSKGVVHMPLHDLTKTVRFKLLTESVVFREFGLDTGSMWTVTLSGGSSPAVTFPLVRSGIAGSGPIHFQLPVGSYNFTVADSDSQVASPSSGTVSVLTAPSPRFTETVIFT